MPLCGDRYGARAHGAHLLVQAAEDNLANGWAVPS